MNRNKCKAGVQKKIWCTWRNKEPSRKEPKITWYGTTATPVQNPMNLNFGRTRSDRSLPRPPRADTAGPRVVALRRTSRSLFWLGKGFGSPTKRDHRLGSEFGSAAVPRGRCRDICSSQHPSGDPSLASKILLPHRVVLVVA